MLLTGVLGLSTLLVPIFGYLELSEKMHRYENLHPGQGADVLMQVDSYC